MRERRPPRQWAVCLFGLSLLLLGPASCDDDDDDEGYIGMPCNADVECPGLCCRSNECGGGMCTYRCRDDRECPPGTLCQDGTCFWACYSDRDCAPNESCEHDRVCQH